MPIDVRKSPEIQAAILTLRSAERSIRLGMNREARGAANPLWRAAVNSRIDTNLERRIVGAGVRATASDRGVTLFAATSTRPLSGGLVPSYEWQAAEFGADPKIVQARRGSTSYPLWVNRQWQQRHSRGMVAMAAASETGTKIVALWVTTIIDYLREIPEAEITPR